MRNPGAEEGSANGWTPQGPSTVIIDSNPVFNTGYNPHNGSSYCFFGGLGSNGASSSLFQNVQLLDGVQGFTESQLDAGLLKVELIFYYQSWDYLFMPYDQAEVILTFRSGSSSTLQTITSGEQACKTNPGWCPYRRVVPLPRGTRSIDYTMTFIRKDIVGTNIDSYIDDNSLRII